MAMAGVLCRHGAIKRCQRIHLLCAISAVALAKRNHWHQCQNSLQSGEIHVAQEGVILGLSAMVVMVSST